jgi:hypothetical protein
MPMALEEKDKYVTITFTTTCNYLVFATKFLLFTTSGICIILRSIRSVNNNLFIHIITKCIHMHYQYYKIT